MLSSCQDLAMFLPCSHQDPAMVRTRQDLVGPLKDLAITLHDFTTFPKIYITESTLQDLDTMLKLGNHNYFKLKLTTKQLTQTGIVIVVCAIAVAVSVFTEGFHASPARTIAAQAFLSADC
jgi:hypothetical protein